MSHSPEPWKVVEAPDGGGPDKIVDRDSRDVCVLSSEICHLSDAIRIRECVNFCDGADIEDLRAGLGRFVEAKLEAQKLFITPKLDKTIKRLKLSGPSAAVVIATRGDEVVEKHK